MSDFPDLGEFSTPIGTNASIDDIDFDRAASAFPDISLDGSGDIPSMPTNHAASVSNDFDFDTFATPSLERQTEVKVTGDDEIDKFESEFPEIDMGQHISPPPAQVTSFTPTVAPRPQPSAAPILTQPINEEEPQVIKDWREKQREEIEAREAASKQRRQDTISKAEKAIDEFYENYAEKKERNIAENKDQEAEFVASQQSFLSTGTTWERICKIVELDNSQSKTLARTGAGTTDLTRFKEVLLRLKREGDTAPGAGGY